MTAGRVASIWCHSGSEHISIYLSLLQMSSLIRLCLAQESIAGKYGAHMPYRNALKDEIAAVKVTLLH